MFRKIAITLFLLGSNLAFAEVPKQEINILFVGKTQTGKSSLINIFYNHIIGKKFEDQRAIVIPLLDGSDKFFVNVDEFKAYEVELRDLNQSQTSKVLRYSAQNDKYIVHLWDAPGFNDTSRQITDEDIVKNIAEAIGETSFNAVAVVLKPNEPKAFDMASNIDRIRTMLPKSAAKNIIGIYTRAANLSPGVRKSGVAAFANLLEIPHGAPVPKVYYMDGSSFFSEVDLNDEESLNQGQARWFSDGLVVNKIVSDAAAVEPFHASDVLTIQKTIEDLEHKIEARKRTLELLDVTAANIKTILNEISSAEGKRDDNKNYEKERRLAIEKEVIAYERRWYSAWLYEHEAGKTIERHEGKATYTDDEQKARFLQAHEMIELKQSDLDLHKHIELRLTKSEKNLLDELVALERQRRNLALSTNLDSFLVYINEQIRAAEKDPDQVSAHNRLEILEKRKGRYEALKALQDSDKMEL